MGVEVEDRPVIRLVCLIDRLAAEHAAGVVDHPVERAEMAGCRLHYGHRVVVLRDVALDEEGVTAGRGDRLGDGFRFRLAGIVVDRDPGALGGERFRHPRADAGRGAGDEEDLVGEIGDRERGQGVVLRLRSGRLFLPGLGPP